MDLAVFYTSSPDWIKALMVILPHATLLGIAWLVIRRPAPAPFPVAAPAPAPAPRSMSGPVVEVLAAPPRVGTNLQELEVQERDRLTREN